MHLGHQRLVRTAVDRGHALGVASIVYTFDPPPKVVFGTARLLTPIDEKLRRLSLFGPDHVVVATFDSRFAQRSADMFIAELGRLGALEIWIGDDFRFGAGRRGDVGLLARCFDVHRLPPVVCAAGQIISSTRIRTLLNEGRAAEAEPLHGWRIGTPASTDRGIRA